MNNNDNNNVVSFKDKRKQYKKKKLRKGASKGSSNVDWKVYVQVVLFLAFLAFAMQQC